MTDRRSADQPSLIRLRREDGSTRREDDGPLALRHPPGERVDPVAVAQHLRRAAGASTQCPASVPGTVAASIPCRGHQHDVDGVAVQRHGLAVGERIEVRVEVVALGEAAPPRPGTRSPRRRPGCGRSPKPIRAAVAVVDDREGLARLRREVRTEQGGLDHRADAQQRAPAPPGPPATVCPRPSPWRVSQVATMAMPMAQGRPRP